jgi:hypothetical protein
LKKRLILYAQKIEKMKLKIKNLKNDQIKNENNNNETYLVCWLSLFLVAPKTIAKQRGGREYMGKQKQRVATRG